MPKIFFKKTAKLAMLALVGWATLRTDDFLLRKEVLSADPALLLSLGRHFMVGYQDFEEIKQLVSHGAIGGIFITRRNIAGKSAAEIKRELDELQRIQADLGLPPLLIATDQEGGTISKLSPPLRELPTLGEWVKDHGMDSVEDFVRMQAEDLLSLGVNVNFSPVVDLKPKGRAGILDFNSRIDLRGISPDPETVTQVGLAYSRFLKQHGVMPTLKHFPGLSSLDTDTHLQKGRIKLSFEELAEKDLKPFREILHSTETFLMLGHVVIPDLDPEFPASLSRSVVQKLLRREWNFQGVIVTDDMTMGAIVRAPGGIGPAAVRSLNAGVDLLLFTRQPSLYYSAMRETLRAQRRGELALGFLEQSECRLAKIATEIQGRKIEKISNGDVSWEPSALAASH